MTSAGRRSTTPAPWASARCADSRPSRPPRRRGRRAARGRRRPGAIKRRAVGAQVVAPLLGGVRSCRRRRAQLGGSSQTRRGSVSLNWRMLAKPAAKATSATTPVVSIRMRAVCARCARGERRAGRRRPPRPAGGSGGARCSRGGAARPRRPRGRRRRRRSTASRDRRGRPVGPTPASRAWRPAGSACTPGSRPLGRRGGGEEAHVVRAWGAGRTARAAVDARSCHRAEDPAVEAGILGRDGLRHLVGVEDHGVNAGARRRRDLAGIGHRRLRPCPPRKRLLDAGAGRPGQHDVAVLVFVATVSRPPLAAVVAHGGDLAVAVSVSPGNTCFTNRTP